MNRTLAAVVIAIGCSLPAFSQSLSILGLDTSAYPQLSARIAALDAAGKLVSISPGDLTVTEDGAPRTVTGVSCPSTTTSRALSAILTVDVSGSMGWVPPSGVANIDLAKAAAHAWVAAMPLGKSECAITSFDHLNYLNTAFTTDVTVLGNSIDQLQPQGGTDYDQALKNPIAGGLVVAQSAKHQRVLVMLTDGLPNVQPDVNGIVALATQLNCVIYAVTLNMPAPQSLKDITARTGGECFESVTSVKDAEDIYRLILQISEAGGPCTVTWQSAPSCTNGQHSVSMRLASSGATATESYFPPFAAQASLRFQPASIFCANKIPGTPFDTTVTVTAVNAPFTVTNVTVSGTAFDINPKSFSLGTGQSTTLTVRFTPSDSGYLWSVFTFETSVCTQSYSASGGFVGVGPKGMKLTIDRPNGGETYVAGLDTAILWSGVAPADSVDLDLSTDGGGTWTKIGRGSGGTYTWSVPNSPSTMCSVRGTLISAGTGGGTWTEQAGESSANDWGDMVVVDAMGNSYVLGKFESTAQFGSLTLSQRATASQDVIGDVFLAKYRPDGSVEWVQDVGQVFLQLPSRGLALDKLGNVYIAVGFHDNLTVGGVAVTNAFVSNPATYDTYVAKLHPDGTAFWAHPLGGFDYDIGGIAVDANGNAYVAGYFPSDGNPVTVGGISVTSGSGFFVAKYKSDGTPEWARGGDGPVQQCYAQPVMMKDDGQGNVYVYGEFQGSVTWDGNNVSGTVSDQTSSCLFLVKLSEATGVAQWAQKLGSSVANAGWDLTCDALGNAYVTGIASGSATFGSTTIPISASFFLACYRPDGSVAWAQNPNYGASISIDPAGDIWAAGLGFAKLNSQGVLQKEWMEQYVGRGMGLTSSGDVIVTGFFTNSGTIDGTTITSTGGTDIFLHKHLLAPPQVDESDQLFTIVTPSLTSMNVDMGSVAIGTNRDSVVSAYITNPGTYLLKVDSIGFSGIGAANFSVVSNGPPFVIPAGGSHAIEFRFKPTTVGLRRPTVRISAGGKVFTQQISGTGVTAQLSITTPVIDFGNVILGDHRDSTLLTIRNSGGATLNISATRHASPNAVDFTTISGGGSLAIPPGSSATMTLRFAPSSAGPTNGRLLFDYSGQGSPAVVELTGNGVLTGPQIQAAALGFDPLVCSTAGIDTEIIANAGTAPLTVSGLSIGGDNAADFSLVSPFVPTTIQPNESLRVAVNFQPAASGNRSAILTISSNSLTDNPLDITLSGYKGNGSLSISESLIDLGVLCPGSARDTSLTITNAGNQQDVVHVTTQGVTADKSTLTFSAGSSATLNLHVAASATQGPFDYTVSLLDSLCGAPAIVHVVGTVAVPQLVAPNLRLPAVPGVPVTMSMRLRNPGATALTISSAPLVAPFVIVSPSFPLTIPAFDSIDLRVRYTAQDTNSRQVTATFAGQPCSFTASATISAGGSSGVLIIAAQSAAAYPSVDIDVPVVIVDTSGLSQLSGSTISTTLTYNATLLFPQGSTPAGTVDATKTVRSIALTFPLPPQNGNVLGVLHFRTMLGTDTTTVLALSNSVLGGGAAVTAIDGEFTLLGTCAAGGKPLFYPSGSVQLSTATPNPTTGNTIVTLNIIEDGPTRLSLLNTMGSEVRLIVDGPLVPGSHDVSIATDGIPPGMYFLVLQTPTVRETSRLVVVK